MIEYLVLILVWGLVRRGGFEGFWVSLVLKIYFFFFRTVEVFRKKRENRRKWKRYFLIGLAIVGGGTVIGKVSLDEMRRWYVG